MRDICIPVSTAQALAETLDLRQVIITAWDGEQVHVVTYGGSVADSANAAAGGNRVKRALGWPANLEAETPKVRLLEARIAELEAEVEELEEQIKPMNFDSISNGEHRVMFFLNGEDVGSANYDEHGSAGMRLAREIFSNIATVLDAPCCHMEGPEA
jgi:hypothetical protein